MYLKGYFVNKDFGYAAIFLMATNYNKRKTFNRKT